MPKTFASVIITIVALYGLSPMDANAAVKAQTVAYTVDNEKFTGYLTYDDAYSGKRPGIIVVHEWWGHDAYARKRAEMLAKLGYTALALDMYGTGKLASHPKDAKSFMMAATKSVGQMKSRFLAAYNLPGDRLQTYQKNLRETSQMLPRSFSYSSEKLTK